MGVVAVFLRSLPATRRTYDLSVPLFKTNPRTTTHTTLELNSTNICKTYAHLFEYISCDVSACDFSHLRINRLSFFPHRAMALCLAMMMGRVGSMLGSNLIGFLLSSNCALTFYLFGGVIILNGLVCFTLPSKKKMNKTNTNIEPTQFQTHEPA